VKLPQMEKNYGKSLKMLDFFFHRRNTRQQPYGKEVDGIKRGGE